MRNAALLLTALAVLTACGSTDVPRHARGYHFYRMETLPEALEPRPHGPAEGEALGYTIAVEFLEITGPRSQVLHAPKLTVFAGQTANIVVANQISYVSTFETEVVEAAYIADPVIGTLQLGLQMELSAVPSPDGDGRVLLGFHLHSSDSRDEMPQADFPIGGFASTIQLPAVERGMATGARTLEPGVKSLLAELPEPNGLRRVRVLAHVVPVGLPSPVPEPADFELEPDAERGPALEQLLASAQSDDAPRGRLELEMIAITDKLPLGAPLEHLPDQQIYFSLRTMALVGSLVPGARVAGLLDEAYLADFEVKTVGDTSVASPVVGQHRSGIVAEMLDRDRLRIQWTTTPHWEAFEAAMPDGGSATLDRPRTATHEVEVKLMPGTHFVPLARLAGGGTAAMRVTFRRDPQRKRRSGTGEVPDPRRTAGR